MTLLLSACNFYLKPPETTVSPLPSLAPTRIAQTAVPQIGITAPAPTPSTAPACTPDASTAARHYAAIVSIELAQHTVTGTLKTTFRNNTGSRLDTVVFVIVQARKPGVFTLSSFSTNAVSDSYTWSGGRLDVKLGQPLLPGCSTTLTMGFSLKVPLIPEGAAGGFGYFGYSDRQLNLGDWLPVIAPFTDGAWLVPRDWNIGETDVTDSASYEVNVTVHGGNPDKLLVAGPGVVNRVDATSWQFTLEHGRNFALSISEAFTEQIALTPEGVSIEFYGFAHTTGSEARTQALATARDAVARFTELFGACPYKRLVVVQGDFPDGMEFSGIVFVGNGWFAGYEGKPDSYLTLITAHEVAHQWWYSSVGDDQGQHPYLDETFAIYSEVLFLEKKYPDLVKWWWSWRVNLYQPQGYVDSTVYEFKAGRPYINAVYLRGALMLAEIRAAIGDVAFFHWLRDYATKEADQIATPAALWGLLSRADYLRTAEIRARYMRSPDPLNLLIAPTLSDDHSVEPTPNG